MRKFRNCCAVSTESAGVQSVEITMERYEQLVEAEVKLKAIKDVAEVDTGSYGYTECTSRTIDILVGIERNEK